MEVYEIEVENLRKILPNGNNSGKLTLGQFADLNKLGINKSVDLIKEFNGCVACSTLSKTFEMPSNLYTYFKLKGYDLYIDIEYSVLPPYLEINDKNSIAGVGMNYAIREKKITVNEYRLIEKTLGNYMKYRNDIDYNIYFDEINDCERFLKHLADSYNVQGDIIVI